MRARVGPAKAKAAQVPREPREPQAVATAVAAQEAREADVMDVVMVEAVAWPPGASLAAVAALCTVVGAATKKRTHAVAVSANQSAAATEEWQRKRAAHAAATAPPAAASAATPGVGSSVEHGPSTLSVSLVPAPSATGSGKQGRLAYTDAEDEHIWNHVAANGPRDWPALQLPGRTADSVRTRWNRATGQLLLEKTRLIDARNADTRAGGYRRDSTPRSFTAVDNDGHVTLVWA